jgi:hypothetical protein
VNDTGSGIMNARDPDRISRSAVIALALGLLGCIPLIGFLGAILGVVTLYRIGGSSGRLGGRTPAAVGLALGLITTAAWLSLGLGMRQAYAGYARDLATPTAEYFRAIERGDLQAAAAPFEGGRAPTAEEVAAFAVAIRQNLGTAQGPTATFDDARALWGLRRIIPAGEPGVPYAGGPLKFDKGVASVLFRLRPGTTPTPHFPATGVEEILVTMPDGTTIRLPETPSAGGAR